MNSYIYIVEWFSMEPYSDIGGPAKAFTSREAAETFIKENNKTYGEGYVKYDEDADDEDPRGYRKIYKTVLRYFPKSSCFQDPMSKKWRLIDRYAD